MVGRLTVATSRDATPGAAGVAVTRCSCRSTPSAHSRIVQSAWKPMPAAQPLQLAHHSTVIGPPTVVGPGRGPFDGQPDPTARHQIQLGS